MQRFRVGINGDWSPGNLHPLAQGQITFVLEETHGKISKIDYELGFNHRGDEKVLEARDFRQGLSLINRPGWQVPIAFELAYARACEDLMGLKVPARAVAIRELLLQIQIWISRYRFWLALQDSIGKSDPAQTQKLETAMQLHEQLSGGRLHDAFLRLGGVAFDISKVDLDVCEDFWTNAAQIMFEFSEFSPANQQRLAKLNLASDSVLQAISNLRNSEGEFAVQLPKVVKVPRGQSFKSVQSLVYESAVWLHSDGGKAPARIALIPASLRLLTELQTSAIGLNLEQFQELLLCTPLAIGELDR